MSAPWMRKAGKARLAIAGVFLLAGAFALAQAPAGESALPKLDPANLPPAQPGQPAPKQKPSPAPPQQPAHSTNSQPASSEYHGNPNDIVVTTRAVLVPTTVYDPSQRGYVNGLSVKDFTLYDNGKEQRINSDFSYEPLSVVVCVQANSSVEAMIPKLKTIGVLLHGLVTGATGDVAVLAFDHRLRVLQDWTNDPDRLDDSMQKLTAGSSTARTIDAVLEAGRMLKQHDPENRRRRVILMISQGYDKGSEAKTEETLRQMQFDNIVVYAVDISKAASALMKTPDTSSRPLAGGIPPEAIHSINGTNNATSVLQNHPGGNALNVVPPVWRSIKDLFKLPPDQAFTRMTGGRVYSFARQRGLEEAVSDIGANLHSQYLLSYTPNNQTEPGFHKIRVDVDHPGLKIEARQGYYWGGGAIQ
jgi:VWFA-related protein